MKAVLLAGGLGTRFSEETDVRPKPMIEIGGKPILWHIMKIYSSHGINDFIVCLGYKGYVIKEYFSNYFLHQSNVTFDLRENKMDVLRKHAEPWTVTLIDTGENTMIGGRIKQILPYIGDDRRLLPDLRRRRRRYRHHRKHRLPSPRRTTCDRDRNPAARPLWRHQFRGQPRHQLSGKAQRRRRLDQWRVFRVVAQGRRATSRATQTVWEKEPMTNLAKDGQLSVFFHNGFWHPMDTLRDKRYLEDLWSSDKAPWKKW